MDSLQIDLPDILDSIPEDYLNTYKTFTDRYFSKRYIVNANGREHNDIMIMFHSNRICLLCLAPSHSFFKNKSDYKVNFEIGNVNRLNNKVKGKGKKGGQQLSPKSIICKVEYDDGSSFEVPGCMKATLVEVNENLVDNPQLLRKFPDADGYIAVMLSSIAISEATKNELLTYEEYVKVLNSSKD